MSITINGSGTITGITAGGLPDAIITQPDLATGVAGTGPAFSAYASGTIAMTAATFTKLPINTKEFDTNSNFDNVTNYRFTPTVAGYYQLNAGYSNSYTAGANNSFIAIYKNGSNYKQGNLVTSATGVGCLVVVNSLVYMNGTTDYVEIYGYSSNAANTSSGQNTTYFNGALVRAA